MELSAAVWPKIRRVEDLLRQASPVLIAYSGGVDSSVLLALAQRAQINFLGLIADSPSLPRASLEDALQQAARLEAPVEVLHTQELDDPRYASNPPNRCYFCKAELFQRMEEAAHQRGFASLAYGENADDPPYDRPGSLAAREFSVLAPLRAAGLGKAEIRQIARELQLSSADRPAMPCLSSRIPHGQPVTAQSLSRVEKAEALLLAAGYQIVRVRHLMSDHGPTARILVSPAEVPRLLAEAPSLRPSLADCGFVEIEFDPNGYRGLIA